MAIFTMQEPTLPSPTLPDGWHKPDHKDAVASSKTPRSGLRKER